MKTSLMIGLILVAAATFLAEPAHAQTRLSLDAGGLLPVGDMADVHKLSPYVGARFEQQATNALGHISTRTWFLRFGYGFMLKEDIEGLPEDASDGHYLDLCLGGRAYAASRFSPFFMSLSGGYANFQAPGPGDSHHGGTVNGGLGVRFGLIGFVVEVEARGHLVFLDGADNIQFFTGIVSLGIPL
jgi:hypothetical protein